MKYRADIDGLRALAVLPVMAYHFGVNGLAGGFIGVDVFFVISGFLITSIINIEIEKRNFSILRFYKKRALRLLPPLLAMMLCSVIVGYNLLLPNEFEELGKSVISTTLFSSNIFFWSSSGYFDGPSEMKPLLHTWSLAVEEQFYIFFPVILIVTSKFKKEVLLAIIVAGGLLSFFASIVGLYLEPSGTFYLLPTRAWELGVGALLALPKMKSITNEVTNKKATLLNLLGLGLILFGYYWLDESKPFPSYNAVYPCIGAALVIAFGEKSLGGKLLSFRPLVYVGLISYSLYLWHWPVIVFLRILNYQLGLSNAGLATVAFGVSFAAAIVTRYTLELPVQGKMRVKETGFVLKGAVLSILLMSALGGAMAANKDIVSGNYSDEILKVADFTNYREYPDYEVQFKKGRCLIGESNDYNKFDRTYCLKIIPEKPNYLVMGDSHAAQLVEALRRQYPDKNFLQGTSSGCRPLYKGEGSSGCLELMEYIFSDFLKNNKIDGVILAGRWRHEAKIDDLKYLPETVKYLNSVVPKVIIFGPTVEYQGVFPIILAQSLVRHDAGIVDSSRKKDRRELDDLVRRAVDKTNAKYISLYKLICPTREKLECKTLTATGIPLQFDYGHLTLEGAEFALADMPDLFASGE